MSAVKKPSKSPSEYHEGMKQKWLRLGNGYYDQFGFEIIRGVCYKLYWKELFIAQTHSIQASKEISLILINDKIMHR